METLEELKDKRNKIREILKNSSSTDIVGVGVDSTERRLLVFHSGKKQRAEASLRKVIGKHLPKALTWQLQINILELRQANAKSSFQPKAEASDKPFLLMPGDEIRPQGGIQGRASCFVFLDDGKPAVLTAGHLFFSRRQHSVCDWDDSSAPNCEVIGNFREVAGIQKFPPFSLVDCATFLPYPNVTLGKHPEMTNLVVKEEEMAAVTGRLVKRLRGHQGRVIDTEAAIKYPVYLGEDVGWGEVLLDEQVLVKNVAGSFGSPGDSGSLVIIDEDNQNGSLQRGAALGLYIATVDSGDYHFATPLHRCLEAVGAKGLLPGRIVRRDSEERLSLPKQQDLRIDPPVLGGTS